MIKFLLQIGLSVFLLVGASNVSAQTNYSLYSLENVFPVCISPNSDVMYGISWEGSKSSVNVYDVKTGQVKVKYTKDIPENPIKLMVAHPKKDLLYFVTARKADDTGTRYIDAIYQMNTKNGKIQQIAKVYYNYLVPNKMGLVDELLVLTTSKKPTYVFDLKKKAFRLLNANINYQLLSIAPSRSGFFMINVNETKNGEIPVHFMNKDNEVSDAFGYITKKMTVNSDQKTVQIPTITFIDSTYDWIAHDIRYNSFPIMNFEIAMRPYWLKQIYQLDKIYAISGVASANDYYLAARSGYNVYVYNYASPKSDPPTTLTQQDVDSIEYYMNNRPKYEQLMIESKAVDQVFDGVFYKVYSQSKFKHVAVQQYSSYFELNEYAMLTEMVQVDFLLIDKKAAYLFQEALNELFPTNTFNRVEVSNVKTEKGWRFVRGKAFGFDYGIDVETDEAGKIINIVYKSELK